MTKLEALRTLAAKVEVGDENRFAHSFLDEVRSWRSPLEYFEITNLVHRAYHGSLDAAQALHEALLPGWHFDIDSEAGGVCVFKSALDSAELGKCECLARAWLLTILKALIAQEEAK